MDLVIHAIRIDQVDLGMAAQAAPATVLVVQVDPADLATDPAVPVGRVGCSAAGSSREALLLSKR
ncbi:hypothetical protein F7230_04955 [Corynebacterium sp. 320]|uniref:hypothetical protein n=1 Tax=Corynebacterium TaxID=1716 RepID=UPI00125CC288|nr:MULTISPECIES: hypothetical protein [Corynebacterium]KAB1504418.1 hypothetical protein F7230_04955 [Corynebacterium sp. 320]KAB1552483.1 hypothetical protein F7233_01645 [Corynebacterium sp. 321]KAB1554302.1 hypothetical protein F7232_04955 [Corynebacterium sp. 319]KAB3528554.1 hypothetical protein F8354_04955 [Corynebacterium sp. 250]KAB3539954.1 hypothetical protein F8390_01375 [Corynebacterium sp. 366]